MIAMSQPDRLLLFYFLLLASAAGAETRHHVSRYQLWRGCVPELAVTINGETFGPTVHAAKGGTAGLTFIALVCTDQISGPTICTVQGAAAYVTVENSPLTEIVAIHWHGIRVTQGDNIVVTVTNSLLTEKVAIDWHGICQIGTEGVGMQRSAELNGRGRFDNCSTMASCDATHPQCSTPVFSVVPGKTYPFCIASVTSLSALNFEVEPLTIDGPRLLRVGDVEITAGVHLGSSTPAFTVVPGNHETSLSAHDFEIDQLSHSDDGRAWFNWSLSVSSVRDAMRTAGYSPPALAGAAGKMHHIVPTLSELSSDLLFDRTVQFTTASGIALIMMVHVALDDQRKKNKGGRDANFAKALLILLAIIAALLNPAMAARPLHGGGGGGGYDQAATGPVAAAPVLMPQSMATEGHSACTNDPNTQDPYHCVHH